MRFHCPSLCGCGGGAASYESEGKLSKALMKIQVRRMAEMCQIENSSKNSQAKVFVFLWFTKLAQDYHQVFVNSRIQIPSVDSSPQDINTNFILWLPNFWKIKILKLVGDCWVCFKINWVCSKLKPIIFCCKTQTHALEFSFAGMGIFGSKQNPQSSHISLEK